MHKRINKHLEDVKSAVKGMNAHSAFAFALACTERQWPIFQRASKSVPEMSGWQTTLRRDLDNAWEHVLNNTLLQFSDPLEHFRELLVFWAAGTPEIEDTGGLSSAVVHTIANSIADLLGNLPEARVASAYFTALRNFDLLELLLDEHGVLLNDLKEKNDHDPAEVAAVKLIEQEMLRENRDLEALIDASSIGVVAAVRELVEHEMLQQSQDLQALANASFMEVKEVQRTSQGKSLFGQLFT